MAPVVKIATCCGMLSFSGGLAKSAMLAAVIAHLAEGAQKWIVIGPAGWAINEARRGLLATKGIARIRAWILGTIQPVAWPGALLAIVKTRAREKDRGGQGRYTFPAEDLSTQLRWKPVV